MTATIESLLAQNWYSTIELAPGKFTNGGLFRNLAVTRRMLDALEVAGRSCLDIGTMEGVVPTILTRRAAHVLAADSIDIRKQVEAVQHHYAVDFRYLPHVPVENYADAILAFQGTVNISAGIQPLAYGTQSHLGFDLVVSSGILHHVNNPVDHIATCRKLLKRDGILLLETPAMIDDTIFLTHNLRGDQHIWNGKATWYASTKFIETYLKANYLQPLAFCYIPAGGNTDHKMCRLAVAAMAVDCPAFSDQEKGLVEKTELYVSYDFKPLHYYARLCGTSEQPPALLEKLPQGIHLSAGLNVDDISAAEAVEFDESYLKLRLNDT